MWIIYENIFIFVDLGIGNCTIYYCFPSDNGKSQILFFIHFVDKLSKIIQFDIYIQIFKYRKYNWITWDI